MSDFYFRPREFERSGKLYEALGVKYVQKIVMNTLGRNHPKEKSSNYRIGPERRLDNLIAFAEKTCRNETAHVMQIPWTIWVPNYYLERGDMGLTALWGTYAAVNLALVMLQRYNRARTTVAIERGKEREHSMHRQQIDHYSPQF